jgi:hypothetical protein
MGCHRVAFTEYWKPIGFINTERKAWRLVVRDDNGMEWKIRNGGGGESVSRYRTTAYVSDEASCSSLPVQLAVTHGCYTAVVAVLCSFQ